MHGTTRVCPNCGSTKIGVDRSNILSMMALSSSYECQECGYSGMFPEVDNEEVRDQQRAIRDRGKLQETIMTDGPTRGRILIGIIFLLLGIPAAMYAPWGGGRLAGILSLLVGAAIMFEYISAAGRT